MPNKLQQWFDRRFTDKYISKRELENGKKCFHMGRYTPEMTREELIATIGMLDLMVSRLRNGEDHNK